MRIYSFCDFPGNVTLMDYLTFISLCIFLIFSAAFVVSDNRKEHHMPEDSSICLFSSLKTTHLLVCSHCLTFCLFIFIPFIPSLEHVFIGTCFPRSVVQPQYLHSHTRSTIPMVCSSFCVYSFFLTLLFYYVFNPFCGYQYAVLKDGSHICSDGLEESDWKASQKAIECMFLLSLFFCFIHSFLFFSNIYFYICIFLLQYLFLHSYDCLFESLILPLLQSSPIYFTMLLTAVVQIVYNLLKTPNPAHAVEEDIVCFFLFIYLFILIHTSIVVSVI